MRIEIDGELRRLFSPKISQLHTMVRDAQASITTQAVAELARRMGDLETANESLHRDIAALEAFLAEQGTVEREVWVSWCSEWKEEAARLVEEIEAEEDKVDRSSRDDSPECVEESS
jgi:hypothetical protein